MDWQALKQNGIVEQRGGLTRITARFLAHAEGTAGRMKLLNPAAPLTEVINMALYAWNPKLTSNSGDLLEFMQDRGQMGVMPMYA
jgi:hypothetical protein